MSASDDLKDDFLNTEEGMEELPTSGDDPLDFKFRDRATTTNHHYPNLNLRELYDKFEMTEMKELDKPSYVQFYNVINNLIGEKRKENKRQQLQDWAAAEAKAIQS